MPVNGVRASSPHGVKPGSICLQRCTGTIGCFMKSVDWSVPLRTIGMTLVLTVSVEGITLGFHPLLGNTVFSSSAAIAQVTTPQSAALQSVTPQSVTLQSLGLQSIAPQSIAPTLAQGIPDPPRRPPPNQTRPGGGLNPESSALCTPQNESLQALIPVDYPGLTVSDSPTFFFYVPFGNEVVDHAEFSMLLWPGEMQRHYEVEFALPDEPGIISVTLPDTPDYALQEDQYYRWYFNVYCQDGDRIQPDLTVNGTVQRVAQTPERDRQIQNGSPEIWHDTLATVAKQLQATPGDRQLQQQWQELLQHIDAEDLSGAVLYCLAP